MVRTHCLRLSLSFRSYRPLVFSFNLMGSQKLTLLTQDVSVISLKHQDVLNVAACLFEWNHLNESEGIKLFITARTPLFHTAWTCIVGCKSEDTVVVILRKQTI